MDVGEGHEPRPSVDTAEFHERWCGRPPKHRHGRRRLNSERPIMIKALVSFHDRFDVVICVAKELLCARVASIGIAKV